MDPYKIVKYPLSTEKAIRLMDSQNQLVFVVESDANKNVIKKAIEDMFKAKVKHVKTQIQKGKKRAYVTFTKETPAINIATELGLM